MKKYICDACPECTLWDDDYGCQQEEKGGECPTLETPSINQNPVREILFRAYDKTMKRYKPFDGMHDTMTISREGKVEYYNLQNGSGFDEYILEQFIGITDKHGTNIFEGDIVKHSYGGIGVVEFFNALAWDGDCSKHAGFYCKQWFDEYSGPCVLTDYLGFDDVLVIGNIHDNPELLEAR